MTPLKNRWRVCWAVAGREHCESFPAKPLADTFLTTLKNAARDGTPFETATGLPAPPRTARGGDVTWYEHACAYSQMKWPDLAAKSRRSTAEALTTITLALTRPRVHSSTVVTWSNKSATLSHQGAIA